MLEALCRQSSTTLDIVHAEDGPPITQRTSGLAPYKHPKLSAVALQGDDNKPIVSEIRNIIVDPEERRS